MRLADLLGIPTDFRLALALGLLLGLLASLIIIPRARLKLLGAGITGRDINKPHRPTVPEMGGLAVFIAFSVGAFAVLALGGLVPQQETLVLAALAVAAGACITGVLDDLVELRQRFKAFIPFAFAAPLALFVTDYTVQIPLIGAVDFRLLYPLLLVPLGIACASNGFNMLEGFNGLGAGLGIILGATLSAMCLLSNQVTGLALLFPLIGALGGFLYFNWHPATIFPGDTMTLTVGAVLASAAIINKLEFWGALLFLPHVIEFFLKAVSSFTAESFASRVGPDGILHHEGPIHSLTHIVMKHTHSTEPGLVLRLWGLEAVYCALVFAAFAYSTGHWSL